jgi:hypothetical protein
MIHPQTKRHIALKHGAIEIGLLKNLVTQISVIMDVEQEVIIETLFG